MNTKCIECCVSVSIKPSTKLSNSTFNFEENEMRLGEKKRVVIKKNSKYHCYAGFWHANCAIGKWSTVTFLAHHSVYAIHCMPFSHRSKNHWFWTAHTDVINCTLQRILPATAVVCFCQRSRREKKKLSRRISDEDLREGFFYIVCTPKKWEIIFTVQNFHFHFQSS